jgi:monoglucosyldiacylglycerol epimerase
MPAIETIGRWVLVGIEGVALFLVASTMFDVVHFVLHQFLKSRLALLKRVGSLHQAHHDYYTDQLQFDERFARANLLHHVIPEYANQVAFTLPGYFLVGPWPVVVALVIETFIFVMVVIRGGMDEHHIAADRRKGRRNFASGLFVSADYHSLHHIHPERFFSSYVTVFDRLMGTACQINGRSVALTGASGAFGSAMAALLDREGARVTTLKHGVDFTAYDASASDEALQETDVLVLCHGAKGEDAMAANCDSFVALIERFKVLKAVPPLSPSEVWAVGSEIEAHPSFGDPILKGYRKSKVAYARHARRYYSDRNMIYRHIVPSAFRSKMGPGLISGEVAAEWSLLLIKRGFRYVPVTYTGIALVNYFKFAWFTRPATAPIKQSVGVARELAPAGGE